MKKIKAEKITRNTGIAIACMALLFSGCGKSGAAIDVTENTEPQIFISGKDTEDAPTIFVEYAEDEPYPALAMFLAGYYDVPEELYGETRYYYNYIDLNEDGTDEIFVVTVSDEMTGSGGDPALILRSETDGSFTVMKEFERIHTPVLVCNDMTDGWHDLLLDVYGSGQSGGWLLCRYGETVGYGSDESEFPDEPDPELSGTQILSDNLIDDMDRGDYLTLAQ